MLEIARSKLAALGLAAKMGAATGVVALAGSVAAFTGVLPGPVQEPVAAVAEQVGIGIPGGTSAEHPVDAEHRPAQSGELEATEVMDEVPEVPEVPETAGAARSGATQEDGRQFGENSNSAPETFQPAEQPTADSNPGSSFVPGPGPGAGAGAGIRQPR